MNTSTPENNFDLAVIGAGSAGFSAAITAAEFGRLKHYTRLKRQAVFRVSKPAQE